MAAIRQTRTLVCLLACLLLFGGVNFLMGRLEGLVMEPLTGLMYGLPGDLSWVLLDVFCGAIVAQGGLLAIWCVLAPVGFAKRFSVGAIAGLVLFVAWALGQVFSWGELSNEYWQYVWASLLSLPLLAIAFQLPLWPMRMWCGWRILHQADSPRQSEYGTFGIRDILIAMGVLAMTLSAVQLTPVEDASGNHELLLTHLMRSGIVAGISLLVTLPVVAATLRARRLWPALAALLVPYVIVTFGPLAILGIVFGERPPQDDWVSIACITGSLFGCLIAVLLVVRGLGYRLSRGRRQHPNDCPNDCADDLQSPSPVSPLSD